MTHDEILRRALERKAADEQRDEEDADHMEASMALSQLDNEAIATQLFDLWLALAKTEPHEALILEASRRLRVWHATGDEIDRMEDAELAELTKNRTPEEVAEDDALAEKAWKKALQWLTARNRSN